MAGFAPIGGAPIGSPLLGGSGGGGGGTDVELVEGVTVRSTLDVARGYLAQLTEDIEISADLIGYYGVVLVDRMTLAGTPQVTQYLQVEQLTTVEIADQLRIAYNVALSEGVAISLVQLQQLGLVLREQFTVGSQFQANVRYGVTLLQAMTLRDSLAQFFGAELVETMTTTDALGVRTLLSGEITEELQLEVVLTPQLLIAAHLAEGVEIDALQAVQMLFSPTMIEGVEISSAYLEPSGSLTTWAMNVHSGAVTEYSDYNFNSFAKLGNRYIGASEDGLYELLGDSDDSDAIVARMRGGFMQFGGTRLARLKEAYIAIRGQGDFILRIITADGASYDYQTSTRSGRSSKVKMGKGQRSRYFAYELISAGQDFDLDTLEFVPLVLQRRV